MTARRIAIVQARMGSTRLPGKVLKQINGKPMLYYQLERLKLCEALDQIVVATTTNSEDKEVKKFCEEFSYNYYLGKEEDLLSRYFNAAECFEADTIVRLTGDCPLTDPQLVKNGVSIYDNRNVEYLTNSRPPTVPHGLDFQIFSHNILREAWEISEPHHGRHVIQEIKNLIEKQENKFSKAHSYHQDIDFSHIRITVDYQEDFEVIKFILNNNEIKSKWFEYISLLTKYPRYLELNRKFVESVDDKHQS